MRLLALIFLLAAAPAFSQGYPSKPVRIIVNFPAGGIADLYARIIGAKVQESWGQPVVIENRTGAGGNIGAEAVAKSAPDGYTLNMSAIGPHAVNVSLFSKMPYDPVKDFAADRAGARGRGLARGSSVGPGEQRSRADRLRALESRQAHLRFRRHGYREPSGGRVVQDHGEGRDDARSLQGQRAGDHRSARRPDLAPLRHHAHGAAARQGGQAARARDHRRVCAPPPRQICQPSANR